MEDRIVSILESEWDRLIDIEKKYEKLLKEIKNATIKTV